MEDNLRLFYQMEDNLNILVNWMTSLFSNGGRLQKRILQLSVFPAQLFVFPAQLSVFPAQLFVIPAQLSGIPAQLFVFPTQLSVFPA